MSLGGTHAANDHAIGFDGVVGFLDLAGFTAATERLGAVGPAGTEQLRGVINALFGAAIEQVHTAAGEVAWFAGDAIGVVFDTSVTTESAAVGALARAARSVSTMEPVETDAGLITLSIKVGAAAGPVNWRTLPGPQDLTWFGGDAVDNASDAEQHADPGDVVLHPSLAARLPELQTTALTSGMAKLVTDQAFDPSAATPSPFAALRNPNRQPVRVARLEAAGQASLLDEHRPVTSMFIAVPRSTHDVTQLAAMRQEIEDLGGLLQQATEGDKGAVVLALFGAPTALADRHLRAVLASQRLLAIEPSARIGVAAGRVYAGRVGNDARWDYSVIGDRVNTAARLMQAAAKGETLVDQATATGAGAAVVLEPIEPLELKGKAEPEPAHRVTETRVGADFANRTGSTFVGRRAEIAALLGGLQNAGVNVVRAEAGAGKTRLLQQVADLAADQNPHIIAVDQTDRGVPFGLWQRVLTAIAGVDSSAFLHALPQSLADDDRVPLLGAVLGTPVVDNQFTAALGRDDRDDVLDSFVIAILAAFADQEPLHPVVIEDLHWADTASIAMLERLSGRVESVGLSVLASCREDDATAALAQRAAVSVFDLPPIDDEAIAELASSLWLDQFGEVPAESLQADIAERASGSPLFCEQLVAHARSHGVAPLAARIPTDVSVPATLVDLVLARLDRLPEAALGAASFGAIFGRSFRGADLRGAFGQRDDATHLDGGVEILRDQAVIDGLDHYTFHHSLFAETAYERMSFALRSELHQHALEFLEVEHGDELEAHAPALARHAESTNDADRKRRYFRLAADQAAERYANDASRYWCDQLVPLLDGAERGAVHLLLGEIEYIAGDLDDAERHFIHAIKDTDDDVTAAELGLARTLAQQGSTRSAFDLMDNAIEREEAVPHWANVHAVLEAKADLATMLGDIERAEQVEQRHEELVTEFGESHEAGQPIPSLIPLLWLRGDLDAAAVAYEEYFDQLVAANDLATAGRLAADLAGLQHERGNMSLALTWLGTADEMMTQTGSLRTRVELVQANEARLRNDLSDDEGALEVCLTALRTALELGSIRTLGNLLQIASQLHVGRYGIPLARRALVLAERAGDKEATYECLYLLGLHTERLNSRLCRLLLSVVATSGSRYADPSEDALARSGIAPVIERPALLPEGHRLRLRQLLEELDGLAELHYWRLESKQILQRIH